MPEAWVAHYSTTPSLHFVTSSALGISAKLANMKRMSPATKSSMIRREIGDDKVCLLTFDRPESGANIFDAATLSDLNQHVDLIEKDSSLRGLIITSAKKSIFIAGADLKTLLQQAQAGELRAFIAEGQRVFNRIAALKIPTCAAIHGACAGGGYEITLACDWRVASNDLATRIGLPETTLGLVPAWGGSTRLPRLIGAESAAEVILKGKLYSADEAFELGLVDEVVPRDQLIEAARRRLAQGKRTPPPNPGTVTKIDMPRDSNSAPARALGVITTGLGNRLEESLALELDAIVDLGNTESTRNLIRNFFLAEKYKRGTSKAATEKIVHAAVIGAGVMGSGIAQWLSSRGVTVILRDVNLEQINRGLANIDKAYAAAVKRGIMTEEKAKEGRARIIASTAHVELRDVHIVIEAASEKIDIKKAIFRELSTEVGPKTILATNTSALPIGELAAETKLPERVIGMHFFNPVNRMKLIEIAVGKQTSDETKERTLAVARQIGKLPVVVRDSPGFLVNRVLFPYLLEAAELFENGTAVDKIDNALVKWGMPMGPLRLIDEIGVDITVDIADTLAKAYGKRDEPPEILRKMLSAKMLGRKSGSGFYKYEGKPPTPNPPSPGTGSAVASDALDQWRKSQSANEEPVLSEAERSRMDVDLTNRLVFLMVNEAARCLEEKVVESAEDADYGMILGTGFAPFRGGPLRFADHFGLAKLVGEMKQLAQKDDKFVPCELLKKHAQNGTKFYEA